MKLRDNKGSITIFVLVGLLFMSSFLLLSYGSNVSKSKTAKEMFNIMSSTYSYNDGDENAYMRAYTALRKENAEEITKDNSDKSDTSSLELTKTFYGPIKNYKIYGNSIQNVTPSPTNPVEIQSVGDLANLLNPNATLEKVGAYLGINTTGIDKNYTLKISLKEGKTVPTGVYFGFVYYKTETATGASADWLISNGTLNSTYGDAKSYALTTFNPSENYLTGICCHSGTQDVWNSIMDAFEITWVEGIYTDETMPEHVEYGKYRIPVRVSGKNIAIVNDGNLGNMYRLIYGIPVKAGQKITYIVNYKNNSSDLNHKVNPRLCADETLTTTIKDYPGISSNTDVIETITISTDGYFTFCFGYGYTKVEFEKIFVGYGEYTLEDYESYKEQTFNIYLNEPLRKLGEYTDYIDFGTGKVYREVGHTVLNSSMTWRAYSDIQESVLGFYTYDLPNKGIYQTRFLPLSNKLERSDADIAGGGTLSINREMFFLSDVLKVTISKDRISDINTFKSWIDENEVYIDYVLETPDNTETVELPGFVTYEDYTNIQVLTEVGPTKIEATYDGYTFE